ncbi:MAG: 4Fe-4S dicluster domain-containing protein [Bryobacterales bacterium]|nr:4Fe-4S dicluster domain-containing protein [Bryobacterales bacterium]
MTKAILFDSTLCVGCKQCEEACARRWNLPYTEAVAAQERLSEKKLTVVQTHGERYSRRLCMHCGEPSCVSACPVGALEKTALGPVIYHEDRCIGCRYCMLACPFQVPSYEWSAAFPRVRKCNMCYERQREGKPTACSEACPNGATICGERDKLIAEARRRISEKPSEYFNRIYGVREAGGTSVLFLSAVPFEQLGLPAGLPQHALPALTWQALSAVPGVASVGAVALGGIYWITHRREAVRAAEGPARKEER